MTSRDIYGRRPTSNSRGRTNERIMRMSNAAGRIPGAEDALAQAPDGSLAAAMLAFHAAWVEPKGPTTRRAYERTLALLANDLALDGPHPSEAVSALTRERLVAHLDWRLARGFSDPGELQRGALHLSRFSEWLETEHDAHLEAGRALMRAAAGERIERLPPAFHEARSAQELRDTSADASTLGVDARP